MMKAKKNATARMFDALWNGQALTAEMARRKFGIKNVADVVYRLRNEGNAIYTNVRKNEDGGRVFTYRFGSPSKSWAKAKTPAAAREALYAGAISR